jgi:cold shock protein
MEVAAAFGLGLRNCRINHEPHQLRRMCSGCEGQWIFVRAYPSQKELRQFQARETKYDHERVSQPLLCLPFPTDLRRAFFTGAGLWPNSPSQKSKLLPPILDQLEVFMPTGTVKWFNAGKGFGFIQADDGSKDVFVHISDVQAAGLSTLNDGQKVQYELVKGKDGKVSAGNLKAI